MFISLQQYSVEAKEILALSLTPIPPSTKHPHQPCAYSSVVPPPPALPTLQESRDRENAPSTACRTNSLPPPQA